MTQHRGLRTPVTKRQMTIGTVIGVLLMVIPAAILWFGGPWMTGNQQDVMFLLIFTLCLGFAVTFASAFHLAWLRVLDRYANRN